MPTVAEQLRAGREASKLDIYQVAEITKIRTDHLRALEAGDYDQFAAPVYIRGFVRTYAGLLKLDVAKVMADLGLDRPQHLYWAAIGASQIVSNVPAAIALAEYSKDWRLIAYGVNIGGFGFMVGSLANLIALRLSGDRRAWLVFHVYAIPALMLAAAIGWALLFFRQ